MFGSEILTLSITDYTAIAGVLMGLFGVAIGCYNMWKSRVRGPHFNLTEAFVTKRAHENIDVEILLQNIGDRMGYLRWGDIKIKFGETFIDATEQKVEFLGAKKSVFEWQDKADTQIRRRFLFPIRKNRNLNGAIFVAKGEFTSHKGKMISHTWTVPLTGNLKPLPNDLKSPIPPPINKN